MLPVAGQRACRRCCSLCSASDSRVPEAPYRLAVEIWPHRALVREMAGERELASMNQHIFGRGVLRVLGLLCRCDLLEAREHQGAACGA